MPISDFSTYKTLRDDAQQICLPKNMNGAQYATSGAWSHTWNINAFGGSTPSTAVAPDNTTTGAILPSYFGLLDQPAATRRISTFGCNSGGIQAVTPGACMLIDYLSINGGMSANVAGTLTTNLPTAALTRNTDGIGVKMALIVYNQIGSTAGGATVSYDNESGSTKTSPTFVVGGTGRREQGAFINIPITDGDLGVTKINSITMPNTGTAGNFGLVLYRPIAVVPNNLSGGRGKQSVWDMMFHAGHFPEWPNDSCMGVLFSNPSVINIGAQIYLRLIEDDV